MRRATSFLFATIFPLVALGCANETADFYEPSGFSECSAKAIDGEYVVKFRTETHLRKLQMTPKIRENLRRSGNVEWMEPNYRVVPPPWARPNSFIRRPLEHPHALIIGADYAWQRGIRGQGITVAIVDSGIDTRQSRLKDVVREGYNFVDNSEEFKDETGHGTHIAGIIAAHSDREFSGIAPSTTLIAADFMNEDRGDEFNAIRAVEYSIAKGAHIINNSWSNFCSTAIRKSFEGWQSLNVIFVNASGNDAMNIDSSPIFPANLDLVNGLTVGSVNSQGKPSQFSNYGAAVNVYAPGENIYSLSTTELGVGFLVPRSGTSMATAFVSGALALVWSADPNRQASEIVAQLKSETSAEHLERANIVNVKRLLRKSD